MLEKRFAALETRAGSKAGSVAGVVMAYGAVALIGGQFREKFEPGAFGDVSGLDVLARLQHDRGRPIGRTGGGGLELADSADALRAELLLPETADGKDAAELLRARILRGWSVEFKATDERYEDGVRVVERAELRGLGLVDQPAFDDSVAIIAKRCEQSAPALHARRPTAATLWL